MTNGLTIIDFQKTGFYHSADYISFPLGSLGPLWYIRRWSSAHVYARGRKQCCKLHYCLWRVSIKSRLPFSDLWYVLCFQRQSFWRLWDNRDILHEMSNPVFWENKKTITNLSPTELAKRFVMLTLMQFLSTGLLLSLVHSLLPNGPSFSEFIHLFTLMWTKLLFALRKHTYIILTPLNPTFIL